MFRSYKITAICLVISVGMIKPEIEPHPVKSEAATSANKTFKISPQSALAIIILSALSIVHTLDKKEDLQSLTLIKNFAQVYAYCFITTLSHEFGHALAAKLLDGAPLDVHVGKYSSSDGTYLCKAGPVTLHSLNPLLGYASFPASRSKLKRFITLAAGPISGIIGYYVCKSMAYFIHNCRTTKPQTPADAATLVKTSIKQALTTLSPLDSIALGHLCYLLIPFSTWGDSSKLWKLCGIDEELVDKIGDIGPAFIYGLPAAFALQRAIKKL